MRNWVGIEEERGIYFLQAAKRDLVYPHYGWIMFTWYPKRWWTEKVAGEHIDGCTDEEVEQFLIRAQPLLVNLIPEPDDYDLQTVAGFVSGIHCKYLSAILVTMYNASSQDKEKFHQIRK